MTVLALAHSRRSSLTRHSHAWVSRSVRIPFLARPERVSDLLQDAPSQARPLRQLHVRHELRDRAATLGDHNRSPRLGHIVQSFQANVLELAGCYRLHHQNIAIAIWP